MHYINLHSKKMCAMESGMLACTALDPERLSLEFLLEINKIECDCHTSS